MSLALYRRILRVARNCTCSLVRFLLRLRRLEAAVPVLRSSHPQAASPHLYHLFVGEGGYVEQTWIRNEARRRFEENRTLTNPAAIEEAVRQGHNQVDVALHYKICYPRPQYVDPGTMGGESDFHRQSSRANTRLGRLHKSRVQSQFRPAGR